MSDIPMVTVLMPVYNGEEYLRDAIGSILNQIFTDFEFLIIDDGSTDNSKEIIKSYTDHRIRLVENDKNLGLIESLNRGITLAQGEYIARMDCDDISLPMRLARQVEFMEAHPEVGVCGTWVMTIGEPAGDVWRHPVDSETIRCMLLFDTPLSHPSVMMRREIFRNNSLYYNINSEHAEDYELWTRALRYTSIENIGEILLHYRLHPRQVGRRYNEDQLVSAGKVRLAQLNSLSITPSPEELDLHQSISFWRFSPEKNFVEKTEAWFIKLLDANGKSLVFPEPHFSRILAERWFAVCYAAANLGIWTRTCFFNSLLSSHINLSTRENLFFTLKCYLHQLRAQQS